MNLKSLIFSTKSNVQPFPLDNCTGDTDKTQITPISCTFIDVFLLQKFTLNHTKKHSQYTMSYTHSSQIKNSVYRRFGTINYYHPIMMIKIQ